MIWASIISAVKKLGHKTMDTVIEHGGTVGASIPKKVYPDWKSPGLWYFNGKSLIGPFNSKGRVASKGESLIVSNQASLRKSSNKAIFVNTVMIRPIPNIACFYYFSPPMSSPIPDMLKKALEWSSFGFLTNENPNIVM